MCVPVCFLQCCRLLQKIYGHTIDHLHFVTGFVKDNRYNDIQCDDMPDISGKETE
jgi:hypothetical protein